MALSCPNRCSHASYPAARLPQTVVNGPKPGSLYRKARYLTSAKQVAQAPPDQGAEVAFAGRSNAGKSSAINALTDNRSLARTSKTPGRTQLINFFTLDAQRRLVDLPGYGYARAPETVKRQWRSAMEHYLAQRLSLRGLVLVMDVRHPLTDFDRLLLNWCQHAGLLVHVLLTKADKLGRGPAAMTLLQVRRDLASEQIVSSVQLFSALKRDGLETLKAVLDDWLGVGMRATQSPAPMREK